MMDLPPSMTIDVPVMYLACVEASNTTSDAISDGSAMRPSELSDLIASSCSPEKRENRSVCVMPGQPGS